MDVGTISSPSVITGGVPTASGHSTLLAFAIVSTLYLGILICGGLSSILSLMRLPSTSIGLFFCIFLRSESKVKLFSLYRLFQGCSTQGVNLCQRHYSHLHVTIQLRIHHYPHLRVLSASCHLALLPIGIVVWGCQQVDLPTGLSLSLKVFPVFKEFAYEDYSS